MRYAINIDPALPLWLIALVATLAIIAASFGIYHRLRGSIFRIAAVVSTVIALLNPTLLQEDHEKLKSVVALVVDETDSQKFDIRGQQTIDTFNAVSKLLGSMKNFDVRKIVVKNTNSIDQEASTALFKALRVGLQDVPPDQVAGAILITDGQVHDIPDANKPPDYPIHALITGRQRDLDRRIIIEQSPRFGIVGESQTIRFVVEDTNIAASGNVEVRILVNGEYYANKLVQVGSPALFSFDVPHGGKTIVEFETAPLDGEITTVNNRAFAEIEGIRENLRVLLVSGAPYSGERTWRNLLKSDAAVDLVHFTILRPPEKQDGTPINELSLIAFPTRELFVEKIDGFDLIIFDRYQLRGVLPVLYFDNIARYVRDGGAVLIAAGPEFADTFSIFRTPIASILPVVPSGDISEQPFRPVVSDAGKKHPVTRNLPGAEQVPPKWSRWFRQIGAAATTGDVIMNGVDGTPLLVLDRPGQGRIAMLLSDHVWLWARGFEGGGPHVALLRRLSHWLMKEPQLEEEALTATAVGDRLTIIRQTMGENPGELSVLSPSGQLTRMAFKNIGPGRWQAQLTSLSPGLYQLANGELQSLAHVGPANPREYRDVTSSTERLAPLVKATGGLVRRVETASNGIVIPRILPVRAGNLTSGQNWLGLRTTTATVLKGINRLPLYAGFLGLAILLGGLAAMWAREGR